MSLYDITLNDLNGIDDDDEDEGEKKDAFVLKRNVEFKGYKIQRIDEISLLSYTDTEELSSIMFLFNEDKEYPLFRVYLSQKTLEKNFCETRDPEEFYPGVSFSPMKQFTDPLFVITELKFPPDFCNVIHRTGKRTRDILGLLFRYNKFCFYVCQDCIKRCIKKNEQLIGSI